MADRDVGGQAYARMLGRLFELRRGGVKLELGRMRACLDALGKPDAAPRLRIQIGGTNGKGSTVAFAAAILRATGLRVGCFTSPHLNQLAERFTVDGQPCPREHILAAERRVRAAQDPGAPLTFFEMVTAMAVCLFEAASVDVAILEVGLGGRFDATTAVPCEVAAVTGVAMDHQDYLGDSLQEIASEKAAIFRSGQRAVIGASGRPEAIPWLIESARGAGVASLAVIDDVAIGGTRGDLGIPGAGQRANAACAMAVARCAAEVVGRALTFTHIETGLRAARLSGRFEQLGTGPRVFVDGAHNAHAARALAALLAEVAPDGYRLVLGVSAGKDVGAMTSALAEGASHIYASQAAGPRALDAKALCAQIRQVTERPVTDFYKLSEAIDAAVRDAGTAGTVVIAGSLFVVADARRHLCGDVADPVPVTDPV